MVGESQRGVVLAGGVVVVARLEQLLESSRSSAGLLDAPAPVARGAVMRRRRRGRCRAARSRAPSSDARDAAGVLGAATGAIRPTALPREPAPARTHPAAATGGRCSACDVGLVRGELVVGQAEIVGGCVRRRARRGRLSIARWTRAMRASRLGSAAGSVSSAICHDQRGVVDRHAVHRCADHELAGQRGRRERVEQLAERRRRRRRA